MKSVLAVCIYFFSLLFNICVAQQPRLVLPIGKNNRSLTTALSPDTKKLVTYDATDLISLWDAEKGFFLAEIKNPSVQTVAVGFMDNSNEIIVTSRDSTIHILDIYSGKTVRKFHTETDVWDAAGSADGSRVITRGMNTVIMFDRQSGKKIFSYSADFIFGCAFSLNSNYFAYATADSLFIHSATDAALISSVKGNFNMLFPVFSPDSKILFTSNYNEGALYEVPSGKLISTLEGHEGAINYSLFHPAKKIITTCSDDSTARVWNTLNGKLLQTLDKHKGEVNHAFFNKDGTLLLTTALDKTAKNEREIYLWNTTTWMKKRTFRLGQLPVNTASFSNDGHRIIIDFLHSESPRIVDAASGGTLKSLKSSMASTSGAGYSKDGTKIYSLSNDGVSRVWDMKNAKFLQADNKAYYKEVYTGFYSPDMTKVVVPSGLGSVEVWNTGTNKKILTLDKKYHFSWCNFSPDGKLLLTTSLLHDNVNLWGINLPKLWDAETGTVIREFTGHTGGVGKGCFSKDGHLIATPSDDSTAIVWNTASGSIVRQFKHPDKVYFTNFSLQNKYLLTITESGLISVWDIEKNFLAKKMQIIGEKLKNAEISHDFNSLLIVSESNSIKLLSMETGKELYQFFGIGALDFFIRTSDQFYFCSREATRLLYYVTQDLKIISFEQLDVKYNRPDKVLEAIGNTDTALINSYRKAYEKRIKKLGIDTTAFRDGYSVPEADFANRDAIEYEQKIKKLTLHIKGMDSTYKLDRFNVWVNETPVYGQRGISLRNKHSNNFDSSITIKLSQGENRIETSVSNVNGTESYRMPLIVNYTPAIKQKEKTHFIGIGIDRFVEEKYNLQYSAKDIRDLAKKLKEKYGNNIVIDTLFNENVTLSNVKALKKKLLQTTENDKVMIAYSGHGMLSKEYDYYLSTYSVNFENPAPDGLPYDELENLLDNIPARKKLLLIDACHSGEVDKEEMEKIKNFAADTSKTKGAKGVQPLFIQGSKKLGMKNSFELMQQLFVNVGRSTGATVISAAAGTQFALERGDLKNGVFTYSILEFMKDHTMATITQLKEYVNKRVPELTKGLQVPTSRTETNTVNWNVW